MHEVLKRALVEKRNLLEPEALELFKSYGLPTPQYRLATTEEEALKAAEILGYPVVLKIVSPDILHKSDIGGVKVGLTTAEAVTSAYREIMANVQIKKPEAVITGMLVVTQAPKGTECIVGMTKDSQFGPALMFGLGGIFVELLKDVSFRVLPITRKDAEEMIQETKGYQLLKGLRGEKPKDVLSVVDLLLQVASLVEDNPEIREIDINPLLVLEKGSLILDARVIL